MKNLLKLVFSILIGLATVGGLFLLGAYFPQFVFGVIIIIFGTLLVLAIAMPIFEALGGEL